MPELIAIFIGAFVVFATLGVPLIGIIGGRINESRHFKDLDRRALMYDDMLVSQIKSFPQSCPGSTPPTMVIAEVVIASDYLKTFLASLRKIFGGEVKSFERMQRRARREAILRLLEAARSQGYNAICNIRMESADIGGGATMGKNAAAMAAVLATATAYHSVE